MTADEFPVELVPLTRFEWERVVLQVRMPVTTKLVALALATFANRHGDNAHPGNRRLAGALDLSPRTVERQLAWLRGHGLVSRRFAGSRAGRRGLADVYQLVIAEDLPERVRFIESPDTRDACSVDEHPTAVTGDDGEHPTPAARTPDTPDRTPDTRDADHPTRVSPQQAIQQASNQQGSPSSSGTTRAAPLRAALAGLGVDRWTPLGSQEIE